MTDRRVRTGARLTLMDGVLGMDDGTPFPSDHMARPAGRMNMNGRD
jgi:hypothetical protein